WDDQGGQGGFGGGPAGDDSGGPDGLPPGLGESLSEGSPLSESLLEALQEEGFSGTIKDKLGRKVTFVNGVRVRGGTQNQGTQQRKKAARTGNPPAPAPRPPSTLARLASAPGH